MAGKREPSGRGDGDEPADGAGQDDGKQDEPGRPEPMVGTVFWAALVAGGTLTLLGVAALGLDLIGSTPGQLLLCSGLGITFGAFGSAATVRYKGAVVTGVAAVAIVLLLVVNWLIQDDYVEIEVGGDVREARIDLYGDRNYPGALTERGRHLFFVIGDGLRRNHLGMVVVFPAGGDGADESEYPFDCIDKAEVEPFLGSGRVLEWTFSEADGKLRTASATYEIGPCRTADAADDDGGPQLPGLIPGAAAAEPVALKGVIDDLESGSSTVRREARESLAKVGLEAVQPLLESLAAHPDSKRVRLGAAVALAEMLREDKSLRPSLAAQLTEEDLARLVDDAAAEDRTIRVYASEFLYDLGDPRVVPLVFERLATANDDGRYNLLVVLQGAYPELSTREREAVAQKLSGLRDTVGPKTRERIDEVLAQPQSPAAATAERVRGVIADSLAVDEAMLRPEARLADDLGAVGERRAALLAALRDAFDIALAESDAAPLATVGDLIRYVQQQAPP